MGGRRAYKIVGRSLFRPSSSTLMPSSRCDLYKFVACAVLYLTELNPFFRSERVARELNRCLPHRDVLGTPRNDGGLNSRNFIGNARLCARFVTGGRGTQQHGGLAGGDFDVCVCALSEGGEAVLTWLSSIADAVIYGYTPEVFESRVRCVPSPRRPLRRLTICWLLAAVRRAGSHRRSVGWQEFSLQY